jgi:hypothetical protein
VAARALRLKNCGPARFLRRPLRSWLRRRQGTAPCDSCRDTDGTCRQSGKPQKPARVHSPSIITVCFPRFGAPGRTLVTGLATRSLIGNRAAFRARMCSRLFRRRNRFSNLVDCAFLLVAARPPSIHQNGKGQRLAARGRQVSRQRIHLVQRSGFRPQLSFQR